MGGPTRIPNPDHKGQDLKSLWKSSPTQQLPRARSLGRAEKSEVLVHLPLFSSTPRAPSSLGGAVRGRVRGSLRSGRVLGTQATASLCSRAGRGLSLTAETPAAPDGSWHLLWRRLDGGMGLGCDGQTGHCEDPPACHWPRLSKHRSYSSTYY